MLSSSAPLSSHLFVILNSFCMSQVVNSPTHITPNGRVSLINLALISDPTSFQYCHVFPPISNSDHCIVSCHFTHQLVSFCKCNKRTVWIYSKADFTRASELITDTNWDALIGDCIDTSWTNWKLKFLDIMTKTILRKTISVRQNITWLNGYSEEDS